jgi:hypothetical protein
VVFLGQAALVLRRAGLRPRVVHRGHDQVPPAARVQGRGCSVPWSVRAVVGSGRAAAEAAAAHGVSWWLAQSALAWLRQCCRTWTPKP